MVTENEVLEQSKIAYNQWCDLWRSHAVRNSKNEMKPLTDFLAVGMGKACLCIANGYSFEQNIDIIKENQGNCDIFVVDKALKHCFDNDIKPTYCLVADANISYEKYLKPVEHKLQDTYLFSNAHANPEWNENGNWKGIYFFVDEDALGTEKEFSALTNCHNIIPAGTNVSNELIIMLNQSNNKNLNNFFGYDKLLLIGYDYSWYRNKYYAFDHLANGKNNYQRNVFCYNLRGDFVYTSSNLLFSARWLEQYIKTYRVNAVQCSKNSILNSPFKSEDLAYHMRYNYKTDHASRVQSMLKLNRDLNQRLKKIRSDIQSITNEHVRNVLKDF